jgi:serine/threonine protein kinase
MPVVLNQFLETLRQSGLMSEEEIADFLAGLGEDEKPATGDDLAQLLHRHRKLTRFQIQSVYQGKTKGLVLGNYVVLDKIGQGGMGHVYQAQHRRMKRVVALKVLPSAVAKSEKSVERFQREVEAAARLSHPHVVTAYDADQADGVHFLVMEYVAGADLSALVRREGPLPVATALDYVLQAARGLAYAHAQGVIHRDIKPSNLLLDPQGTVKILDLGLARFQRDLEAGSDAPALTQTGQLMGTVDFIAPEQAMDTRTADARSDIYSLGCTLFYLITGRAVYPTGSFAQKVVAHMTHAIPSLSDLRDEVPAELDTVFQRLVAKRPEERPQSMEEVIAQLESCRALVGDSRQASQDTSAIFRGPTGGGDTEPSVETVTPRQGTRRPVTDGLSDWLHQPLPSAATVFRATRRRTPFGARRSQVLAALGIAAGLVGLLLFASIVAALRTDQGTLVVEADEPGASVQVLDEAGQIVVRGVSEADPLTFSLEPGTHRLRVEKDGFTFFAQEFTLDRRGKQVIRARLEPIPEQPGTLHLTVDQPDAAVEVLDVAGKTVARYRLRDEPLAIPLAAGRYRVLVEKTGFESFEVTVAVASGADAPIDVALAAMELTHQPSETSRGTSGGNDQPEGQPEDSPALVVPLTIARTGPEPPPAVAPFDAEQARQHQEAWAAHLGIPVEWTNSIGTKFVLIPASSTTKPFYLATTELTQGEYHSVTGLNPSAFARNGTHSQRVEGVNTERLPVESITFDQAQTFCKMLSDIDDERRLSRIFRLPTSEEWAFACLAGSAGPFHTGLRILPSQANFSFRVGEGATSGPLGRPSVVGSYPPNAFGLFDMHGNVSEFCTNGPILRGGSWAHEDHGLRIGIRFEFAPESSGALDGFRLAVSVSPPEK